MKKLLIIDDDKILAEMYETKFKIEWFDVRVCTEWLEALWILSDFNPDVILLDVMMPQMNWFEVLSTIKELASSLKTKIIMFSNLSSEEVIKRWMEAWADMYLIKADTTPRIAVEKVNELLWVNQICCEKDPAKDEDKYSFCCPHCNKQINIKMD